MARWACLLKAMLAMVSLMEETPKDTTSGRVTRYGKPPRQHGPAIRELRKKDGWSQTRLAKAVGIHQSTLSAIESELSNAADTTLNLIARKLRVPVDAIMRDWDDENAPAETEEAAALCRVPPPATPSSPAAPAP